MQSSEHEHSWKSLWQSQYKIHKHHIRKTFVWYSYFVCYTRIVSFSPLFLCALFQQVGSWQSELSFRLLMHTHRAATTCMKMKYHPFTKYNNNFIRLPFLCFSVKTLFGWMIFISHAYKDIAMIFIVFIFNAIWLACVEAPLPYQNSKRTGKCMAGRRYAVQRKDVCSFR